MTPEYQKDYTDFLSTSEDISKYSPATLLKMYEDFVNELVEDKYVYLDEYNFANDFFFRHRIQGILDSERLKNNQLRDEFAKKIADLDRRIKPLLSTECFNKQNWFDRIAIHPDKLL